MAAIVGNKKYYNLSSLNFLISEFSILSNVADFFEKNLVNLIGKNRVFNLLLHAPVRSEKILFSPKLFEVPNNSLIVIKLKIEGHIKPQNKRQPYKILGITSCDNVSLVFFKIYPQQIEKLAIGREVAILGNLQKNNGEYQIIHPQEIVDIKNIDILPKENLVYSLSGVLTQKFLRSKIIEILQFLESRYDETKAQNNDWIDKNLLKQQGWPLFLPALKALHNYEFSYSNDEQKSALKRLKYDEFLAWQIAMLLVRKQEKKSKIAPQIKSNIADNFLTNLPFEATNCQIKACYEVKMDITSNKTMLRLLQGDVGSGKTIIAIYATLLAFACGKQSCVIVPISILADQHFSYFKKLIETLFLNLKQKIPVIEMLSGKTKAKQRKKILQNLSNGEIDILISTHAVLQDDVIFKNLGLAIIDEQHRFGVMQRLKLVEKGNNVDVLLMSATPIPRSLMMALYGDMDVSVLNQKPRNRLEIDTVIMSQNKSQEVYDGVWRALDRGEKIYWICPLIEDGEEDSVEKKDSENNLISAKNKYQQLCTIFGKEKVALIHGKMKQVEKEKMMEQFKNSTKNILHKTKIHKSLTKTMNESDLQELEISSCNTQILVATTVIEVGVDVPDATVIIIENAENFGLSQLHQLRGRVGRSDKKSYCILLYGKKYGKIAQERLKIMRKSNDGFFIAEEDLRLRGSGELLGVRQSGDLGFRVANLEIDLDLLKIAGKNAQLILNEDSELTSAKSIKYRALLKLFDYDECLKIVTSG